MLRAGFDAFVITHAATVRALEGGELPAVARIYQPSLRPSAGRLFVPRTERRAPGT
jgi:uncharacterized protein (DUF934 family)